MSDDQQQLLQRIYQEQQLTESNITLLQQRLELLQAYLNNFRSGLMVLEEIEGRKEGEDTVPRFRGLHEAYIAVTGEHGADAEGILAACHGLHLDGFNRLKESATTALYSYKDARRYS